MVRTGIPTGDGDTITVDDPTSGGGSSGGSSDSGGSDDEIEEEYRDELGGDPVDSGGRNGDGGTDTTGGGGGTAGGGRGPRFDDDPVSGGGGGGATADPDPEPVSDIRDRVGGTVDDIGNTVSDAGSEVRSRVDSGVEQVSDTVSGGVDQGVERVRDVGTTVRDRVSDASAPEPDREITDDLTRGGLLSETRGGNSGLLPGEVGGVDVSEERLQADADAIDKRAEEEFAESEELTVFGSDLPDRVVTGGAEAAVDVVNLPGLATTAETGVEVATNAPGEIQEQGAGAVGATVFGVGAAAASATVDSAQENPAEFAGGAVFNVVGGAGAGRQLGKVGRATKDRVRTAGGTRVEATDLASDDVVRFADTDGAEGTRFPGADDPELYQSDPASAVRQQADANTPAEIENVFGEAGVGEGATLQKALDTEPDGPGVGRADQGFESAPGETAADFDFETPGSFAGPELSPNFLRVGGRDSSLSVRPGLPDFGNRPTAVAVRTDVENPDADDLAGFNQEMIDRAGETTARTKPASEVNPGEIEAVVPPGAEFQSVGGGGLFGTAGSRLGIGSELYTEVGGRRVPIRTVAPEGRSADVDAPDADGGTGGGLFGEPESGTVESFREPVRDPADNSVPGFGASGSGASSPTGAPSDPFGVTPANTAPSSPVSEPQPQGSTGGAGGSSTGGSGGGGGGAPSGGGSVSSGGAGGTGGGSSGGGSSSPPRGPPSVGPFGGSSSIPGGGGSPPGGGPPESVPGTSIGAPSSGGAPSPAADAGQSFLIGTPRVAERARRRDRDPGRDEEPDAEAFGGEPPLPANTEFVNPIAGNNLFGAAGEGLGPFG